MSQQQQPPSSGQHRQPGQRLEATPPKPQLPKPQPPKPQGARAPQQGGQSRWARSPRWARLTAIICASVLGLLLVSGVALRIALPSIAASYARDYLPEVEQKLGLSLTFEDIDIPSLDHVRLNGVVLRDPTSGEEVASLGKLDVHLRYSIWDVGGLKVARIEAEGLTLTVSRDQNDKTNYEKLRPDIEKMLKPSPPPDPTKPPQPKKENPAAKYFKPMPVIVARDVRVRYRDEMEDLTFDLKLGEANYQVEDSAQRRLDGVQVSGLSIDLTHGDKGKSDLKQIRAQVEEFFRAPQAPVVAAAGAPAAAAPSTKAAALQVAADGVQVRYKDAREGVSVALNVNLDLSRDAKQAPFVFVGELFAELQLGAHPRVTLDLGVKGRARGDDVALDVDVRPTSLLAPLNQALGRPVKLTGFAFESPATVTVRGLEIAGERRDEPSLLRVGKLRVQLRELTPKSLKDLLMKEIDVEDLTARVAFDDDGLPEVNAMIASARAYKDAMDPPQPAPVLAPGEAPPPPPSSKIWYEYFQRVHLTNAQLTLQDLSAPGSPSLTVARLDVSYGFRALRKVADGEVSVALADPLRPELYVQLVFDRASRELSVALTLNDLQAAPLTPILKPYLDKVPLLRRAVQLQEVSLQTSSLDDPQEGVPDLHFTYNMRSHDMSLRGELSLRGLNLNFPTLSHLPIDGLDLNLAVDARYHHERAVFDVPKFVIGNQSAILADIDLTIAPAKLFNDDGGFAPHIASDARFDLRFHIPVQPAQLILESVPYALRHTLQGMQVAGNVGFSLTAEGQLDQLKKTTFTTDLQLAGFDVLTWPAGADLRALNAGLPAMAVLDPNASAPHSIRIPPSTHMIEPLRTSQMQREGFGHPGGFIPRIDDTALANSYPKWVPFRDISPWLIQMVTTTEDGGFFSHKGFSLNQALDALQTNLDKDDFSRGASTISMQLIKNMFLGRDKTIARKLQEAYLTWLMESFLRIPKRRILEVYFNIIEFGPDLYGIREASRHYFGKQPADLSPAEAAFLIALLPRPRDFHRAWVDGTIDNGKLRLIHRYLDIMYARKCDPATLAKLQGSSKPKPFERACPPPDEFEALKAEPLRFYKPHPSDPPFRPDLYFNDGSPRFTISPISPFGINSEDLDESPFPPPF
jgi:hypothetical protein